MSLHYCGWEVIYDKDSPSVELRPSQQPYDRGIYTMYHGTSVASARSILAQGFRQSDTGMLGKGVYVSHDRTKAGRYPLNGHDFDRVVLKLRVRVGRVKRIDKDNHPMQFTWSTMGYDTAWVPPNCGMTSVPSGLEEDCVFNPKNIRVVGIEKAPNERVFAELQQLLRSPSSGNVREAGHSGFRGVVCHLCKRTTLQASPHVTQPCWACGQNICLLMPKHVCRGSLQFYLKNLPLK